MKLHNNNSHLHIDKQDPVADWLVSSMKTAQASTINLNVGSQQDIKIHITDNGNKIMVVLAIN